MALTSISPDRLSWSSFLSGFQWRQGEHVSLIGPTGTGKSTLAFGLVNWRAGLSPDWHATVLATKARDDVMSTLARQRAWTHTNRWPVPWDVRLAIFQPRWRDRADDRQQRAELSAALTDMFRRGSFAVVVDELSYCCRRLRLDPAFSDFWEQGRSLGNSLVGLTQRPAWVPLLLYSAPEHLFFWRTTDRQDLARIAGIGGLDANVIRSTVASLDRHEVLYVNSREGRLIRTKAPRRF
jgi:hypothetical protein